MADVLKIDRECPNCHKITVLAVTGQGFKAWDMGRGAFVQDAFCRGNLRLRMESALNRRIAQNVGD